MLDSKWFVRKVGFGIRPENDFPKDPVKWAHRQVEQVPTSVGIKSCRSESRSLIVPWPTIFEWSLEDRIERLIEYRSETDALEKKFARGSQAYEQADERLEKRLSVQRFDELHRAHQCVYGRSPVFERFAHFWQNHFTVGGSKETTDELIGHLHQAAIKDKMTGSFSDMLYAVTTHPAMLTYLDNIYSIGPKSSKGRDLRRNGEIGDINENLAREVLELHTVSPAAGYTQEDIVGLAKILTGWGYIADKASPDIPTNEKWKVFFPQRHEPGRKKILGGTYAPGYGALQNVLNNLAGHRSTARFICAKLARCFVSDNPDPLVVDAIESIWITSKGYLPEVHKAVIEQVAKVGSADKLLPPEPWLYQLCRISGADLFWGFDDLDQELGGGYERRPSRILEEAGHWFWADRQPDGFSDNSSDWISAEHMDRRVRLSRLASQGGKPEIGPENILTRCGLSATVRDLIEQADNPIDRYTLLFCSDGFMVV